MNSKVYNGSNLLGLILLGVGVGLHDVGGGLVAFGVGLIAINVYHFNIFRKAD